MYMYVCMYIYIYLYIYTYVYVFMYERLCGGIPAKMAEHGIRVSAEVRFARGSLLVLQVRVEGIDIRKLVARLLLLLLLRHLLDDYYSMLLLFSCNIVIVIM